MEEFFYQEMEKLGIRFIDCTPIPKSSDRRNSSMAEYSIKKLEVGIGKKVVSRKIILEKAKKKPEN